MNRAKFLKKTLQSIADQSCAGIDYEVIVVDNGSVDDTKDACGQFKDLIPSLTYHFDSEPGQLTGRHKGIQLSKGDIVSFLDDDVEICPDWISSLFTLFQKHQSVSIIGGACLPKYHAYPPAWLDSFWQPTPYGGKMCLPLSLIDLGCEQANVSPLYIFGLNYSIRKAVLLSLGGFHPDCLPKYLQRYQGDGETGLSLKAAKLNIMALYASSVFLYHQVPAERLTQAYFEKWYYYEGVCRSFTDLRLQSAEGAVPAERLQRTLFQQAISKTGTVIKSVFNKTEAPVSDEIRLLKATFHKKFDEGYAFHQQAFKTDETVQKWVTKENYWNYKLPVNC